MKSGRLAALLIVLAACAGAPAGDAPPTAPAAAPAPEMPGQQMTVDVTASPQQGSGSGAHRASATGGAGRITVQGEMVTPTPCHRLSGSVARSGSSITLTLSARMPEDIGCIQMIATQSYTATVNSVPAGTHTLRVVHTYPGTGWNTETVAEQQVEVR